MQFIFVELVDYQTNVCFHFTVEKTKFSLPEAFNNAATILCHNDVKAVRDYLMDVKNNFFENVILTEVLIKKFFHELNTMIPFSGNFHITPNIKIDLSIDKFDRISCNYLMKDDSIVGKIHNSKYTFLLSETKLAFVEQYYFWIYDFKHKTLTKQNSVNINEKPLYSVYKQYLLVVYENRYELHGENGFYMSEFINQLGTCSIVGNYILFKNSKSSVKINPFTNIPETVNLTDIVFINKTRAVTRKPVLGHVVDKTIFTIYDLESGSSNQFTVVGAILACLYTKIAVRVLTTTKLFCYTTKLEVNKFNLGKCVKGSYESINMYIENDKLCLMCSINNVPWKFKLTVCSAAIYPEFTTITRK